jgi:hypothetical protein
MRTNHASQPFVPIRLILTDDKTYDINHPDMALWTRSTVEVGIESADGSGIADDVVYISLTHIIRVHNLTTPAPPAA